MFLCRKYPNFQISFQWNFSYKLCKKYTFYIYLRIFSLYICLKALKDNKRWAESSIFYKCWLVHRELQAMSLSKLSYTAAMPCPSVLNYLTWSAIQSKGDMEFDYWNHLRIQWGTLIFYCILFDFSIFFA